MNIQQKLIELEEQFMYQDDKFKEIQHDIKTIKNLLTEFNKNFCKIKMEAIQVKLN